MDPAIPDPGQPAETSSETRSTLRAPASFLPSDVAPTAEMPKPPGNRKFLRVFGILLGLFLLLFSVSSALAFGVAYNKIHINNPALEKRIANVVLSIPFLPKTPEFIFESAALAHRKVSKNTIDASIAIQTNASGLSSLGFNSIDAAVKGGLDYSDTKNVKFSLNASVTKEFNIDIRKKDATVYFKINKVPSILTTLLKIDENKLNDVLKNWVAYDTSHLDTEARKQLDSNTDQTSATNDFIQSTITDLDDPKILNAIKITKENMDGHPTYKLHLDATADMIDSIAQKIQKQQNTPSTGTLYQVKPTKASDSVKQLTIDTWVDRNDYYVRKVSFAGTVTSSYSLPSTIPGVLGVHTAVPSVSKVLGINTDLSATQNKNSAKFVVVVKLDDFGKDVTIGIPSKHMTLTEFYQALIATSSYGNPSNNQVGQAKDAQRKNDISMIANALQANYTANEGRAYAVTLNQLVTAGDLKQVPTDPDTHQSYQYIRTKNGKGFQLSAKLSNGTLYTITDQTYGNL